MLSWWHNLEATDTHIRTLTHRSWEKMGEIKAERIDIEWERNKCRQIVHRQSFMGNSDEGLKNCYGIRNSLTSTTCSTCSFWSRAQFQWRTCCYNDMTMDVNTGEIETVWHFDITHIRIMFEEQTYCHASQIKVTQSLSSHIEKFGCRI